ncbi:MAG: Gldg family protein [Gammaproteobacteria bacterium]|nr:Gldg family protein [Gammaproteobacteria bacterium]
MRFAETFAPRRAAAVTRHELRVLFHSPLTYLFQAGFLGALGLCVFQVADFYATDEVSLRLWLLFFPWVGLVFVPALAMNAWPGGGSDGDRSVELALTLPVTAAEWVCGKYLAGLAVLLVMLLCGLAFPATLAYLGDPDWGRVTAGLLASFLLLAAYWAVCIAVAALLGDAIAVFVVSVLALLTLALLGQSELDPLLEGALPGAPAFLRGLSPLGHFHSIASGLLRLSAFSWFALFIILLLSLCGAAVTARRHGRARHLFKFKCLLGAAALLAGAAGLQAALGKLPLEADWTEQREFTLSAAAIDTIRRARADIRIDFFWSEQQSGVPASIRAHAARARSMLKRIEHHSRGRVTVREFDPAPDTDVELRAIEAGMRIVPMTSGDHFTLGLVMRSAGRAHVLPYIDRERERFLEYDLLSALSRLLQPRATRVALLSPLLPPSALNAPRPGLSFVEELKRAHDVALVPFFAEQLPEADALIVLQGAPLKRAMLYAIDQHVMRGGALIAMLDPHVRARPGRVANPMHFQPSTAVDDLSDLLLRYGVRYAGEHIVGDAQLAATVSPDGGETRISYPYWLRFDKQHIGAAHPVVGGLQEVLLVEAGALEFTPGAARALLRTTDDSGMVARDRYQSRPPPGARDLADDFRVDGGERIVAALVEGRLRSAYSDSDSVAANPGHLNASHDGDARVFVVADSDWLFDSFALHTSHIGERVITRPANDNLALLGNMIAYGAGADIAGIPARGRLSRRFTRVAQLFKRVEQAVKVSERTTAENVARLEENLDQIRRIAGVDNVADLPSPLREQALSVRKQLVALRRDLRAIRLQARERIDRLGKTLALLNIAGGPALVAAFGMTVAFARRRRLRIRLAGLR